MASVTMTDTAVGMPPRKPGLLTSAALRLFTRAARVAAAERLSERFRKITLEGEALKDAAWTPGQKLQVQMQGFTFRTYTPVSWDAAAGRTEMIAYAHGDAPGARWALSAAAGDACLVFGPRRSLDFSALSRPALFAGDETSIGPAVALARSGGASGVRFVFEANDAAECLSVLTAFGLSEAQVIARQANDAHYAALEALALGAFAEDRPDGIVLTGKAATIQRLNRALRAAGARPGDIRTKAYWAPGKTGLD